jgi:hypothetical protein
MVCPTMGEDAVRVLDIVLHEMLHAAVGLALPDLRRSGALG